MNHAKNTKLVLAAGIAIMLVFTNVYAQKGIKGSIGIGSIKADQYQDLEKGGAATLNLGYGFNAESTLWLTLVTAKYEDENIQNWNYEFGGIEVVYQHKFAISSSLQPYGKIGLGGYGLREDWTNSSILGGGLLVGLGLDYFFSKHFGLGIELLFRNIEYNRKATKINDDLIVSDLQKKINGDSRGIMLTLTIQ